MGGFGPKRKTRNLGDFFSQGAPARPQLDQLLAEAIADDFYGSTDILGARQSLIKAAPVLFPGFVANWHHVVFSRAMERLANGEILKLAISSPPQHGKSLLFSELGAAWLLGRQDEAVMAVTYSLERAKANAMAVQQIMDSEPYRKLFPNAPLPPKSSVRHGWVRTMTRFAVAGNPRRSYLGIGVGGGGTGYPRSFGILDDLIKNWEEAQSETIRKRNNNWYASVFGTRHNRLRASAAGVRELIVATRWHAEDLTGWILEREGRVEEGGEWTVINIPALYDPSFETHPEDPRQAKPPISRALWPAMISEAELEKRRKLLPDIFDSLYQGAPRSGSSGLFHASQFSRFAPGTALNGEWVVSCDLNFGTSGKKKETHSRVSLQVWVVKHYEKEAYLVHEIWGRFEFPETLQHLSTLKRSYPQIRRFLIEEKANGPAVISMLRRHRIRVDPVNPTGDKVARAGAVQPWVQAGKVFIVQNEVGDAALKRVCDFPKKGTDDTVDAMTQLLVQFGPNPLDLLDFYSAMGAAPTAPSRSRSRIF